MFSVGALVEKDVGQNAYEQIYQMDGVEYVFVENGRSNDLFKERQFGDFGEASIITVVVEDKSKEKVLTALHNLCDLKNTPNGLIFSETKLTKVVSTQKPKK